MVTKEALTYPQLGFYLENYPEEVVGIHAYPEAFPSEPLKGKEKPVRPEASLAEEPAPVFQPEEKPKPKRTRKKKVTE